jgi:hypothetical protein
VYSRKKRSLSPSALARIYFRKNLYFSIMDYYVAGLLEDIIDSLI